MSLKAVEFFEYAMLQKFLGLHDGKIKVLGFSALQNPDRFFLLIDLDTQQIHDIPPSEVLVSVNGSTYFKSLK